MNHYIRRRAALALPLFFFVGSSALRSQSIFTFGFTGPDKLGSDSPAEGTYYCTLLHQNGGTGVEGWSLSMTAEGGEVLSIDIEGTAAKDLFKGGFEHSEVTTGEGNQGAVSAVILAFEEEVTLPADTTSTIARLSVRAGPGQALLRYANGRMGRGQPVVNVVTQNSKSIAPNLSSLEINAPPPPPPLPEACSVSLGDKVGGSLSSMEDRDAYSFSALDGTLFSLSLKGKNGVVPPGLQLLGPGGSAIDLGPYTKTKKLSSTLKNLSLPALGTYTLLVNGGDGAASSYLLGLKGKAPKSRLSLKAAFSASTPGQAFEQSFSGLGRAVLTATIKGKGLSPEVIELVGPGGSAVPLPPGVLFPGAKTTKIKGLTLSSTGTYLLRLRGSEGGTGILTLSLKQKPAKGAVLSECAD